MQFAPLQDPSVIENVVAGPMFRGKSKKEAHEMAAEWIQRQRAAVVPAMIGSLERAERVALALEARHYRLRPVFRGPRSPWIASGAGLALVAAALMWRK